MVREGLWYANSHFLLSFTKNIFTAIGFTYRVLLINSWICVNFPCWFLKMAIIISHSHFVHVAFVSVLVFQTFDQMLFGRLSFPWKGSMWWQYGTQNGTRSEVWKPLVYNITAAACLPPWTLANVCIGDVLAASAQARDLKAEALLLKQELNTAIRPVFRS